MPPEHTPIHEEFPKVLGDKILYEMHPVARDELLEEFTPELLDPDRVDELKEVSYRFRRKKQEALDHLTEQPEERREQTWRHWQESLEL